MLKGRLLLYIPLDLERSSCSTGNVRVTALDVEGGSFVDDVGEGDLW